MHKWLWLIAALVLNAAANILLKVGSRTAGVLPTDATAAQRAGNFLNAVTVLAIALFAANVLFYRKALDSLNVSVAYPVMVSGGLVMVTLAAVLLPVLNERFGAWQVMGIMLIGAGVWMVTRG